MKYECELQKANEFRESIDVIMSGVEVAGSARARLFNAYYHLSLEHFCSIVHLLNLGFYAAAAALLRPQYEAVIRGIYFQDFASDKALKKFIDGDSAPKLSILVGQISKELESEKDSAFHRYFGLAGGLMNEFTHGGIPQINRRFSSNSLVNNFSDKDKYFLAATTLVIARLSVTCALSAAGRKQAASEVLRGIKQS